MLTPLIGEVVILGVEHTNCVIKTQPVPDYQAPIYFY